MNSCVLDPNFTLWNVYLPRAGASRPNSFLFASSYQQTGIDAKLVLAFDAFALSRSLGRELSLGKIIHGDDHATSKVKTSALNGELLPATSKAKAADWQAREIPSFTKRPGDP
jgi:hypothetical protein